MNDLRPDTRALKVAAVARRTGVSVRTLHYYEEIGLLSPSGRTRSGHRLYARRDVERLQQIRSLQQLGLSLSEIQDCLATGKINPQRVIMDHLERVREQQRALARLENQLEKLSCLVGGDAHDDDATIEAFLSAVEVITMHDKYFTPQQIERLQDHESKGEEAVTPVIQALQKALDSGVAPDSDQAQTLLQRFREALEFVSGGDETMVQAIMKMLHAEPEARTAHGISPALFDYMGRIVGGREHPGA